MELGQNKFAWIWTFNVNVPSAFAKAMADKLADRSAGQARLHQWMRQSLVTKPSKRTK